jgi:hypothetical protein
LAIYIYILWGYSLKWTGLKNRPKIYGIGTSNPEMAIDKWNDHEKPNSGFVTNSLHYKVTGDISRLMQILVFSSKPFFGT